MAVMMADIIGLVMKPRGSVRGLGRGATLDRSILGSTATSLLPKAPVRRFKAIWMIWPRRLLDRVSRREDPTDSAPFPLPSFPLPSFPLLSFPFPSFPFPSFPFPSFPFPSFPFPPFPSVTAPIPSVTVPSNRDSAPSRSPLLSLNSASFKDRPFPPKRPSNPFPFPPKNPFPPLPSFPPNKPPSRPLPLPFPAFPPFPASFPPFPALPPVAPPIRPPRPPSAPVFPPRRPRSEVSPVSPVSPPPPAPARPPNRLDKSSCLSSSSLGKTTLPMQSKKPKQIVEVFIVDPPC